MYIILLIYLCCILTQTKGSQRIIGGTKVPPGFGRFHASLQDLSGHHICGGAIISHMHLVTAAHCVIGAKAEYINVVVGTTDLDKGGLNYRVKLIHVHEKYNISLKLNDIAVLEIKELFDLEKVEILRLDHKELQEHEIVLLTGFGAKEPHGESSRRMYALNLKVFNQETCRFAMRYKREVFDSMFCTFTRIGQGGCHGDSGGPLTKDNKLVGLVSWGIPCAVGFPDVHTRLSSYVMWIKSIIDRKLCSYCRPRTLKTAMNFKTYKKYLNDDDELLITQND
ncbi:chymotrypsin-2-like [Maniola jurtina]|uniref:chymotrypsin-2-like n=1 Tax=Maniola jurtina TaxID=191418 RepID=UPI001E68C542|nr:chymotrypsin-2-like [Maniola jurtina]